MGESMREMVVVQAIRDAVRAFAPLVDNAGGYDNSTYRTAILETYGLGGSVGSWSKEELLKREERAREAWRALKGLLDG